MTLYLHIILLAASAIFTILSSHTYVRDILRGTCKPHRTTRFALSLVMLLNFASIAGAHGNPGALIQSGMFALLAVATFILSLKRGIGGKSNFDSICLIIAIAGAIGWKVTNNPVIGIWFSIIADLAAYLPTIIKTWREPHTEGRDTYVFSLLSTICSLVAYHITISSAFQLYLIFVDVILIALISRKQLTEKLSLFFKNKFSRRIPEAYDVADLEPEAR